MCAADLQVAFDLAYVVLVQEVLLHGEAAVLVVQLGQKVMEAHRGQRLVLHVSHVVPARAKYAARSDHDISNKLHVPYTARSLFSCLFCILFLFIVFFFFWFVFLVPYDLSPDFGKQKIRPTRSLVTNAPAQVVLLLTLGTGRPWGVWPIQQGGN